MLASSTAGASALTIAILVLFDTTISVSMCAKTTQDTNCPGADRGQGRLTKREKASLYSETCSSVNASAYKDAIAMSALESKNVGGAPQGGGFKRETRGTREREGYIPW